MLTSSLSLEIGNDVKKSKKLMKFVNIKEENLHKSSQRLRKFDKIFNKYVTYDNIKIHKKQGFTLSMINAFSEKSQREGLLAYLGLKQSFCGTDK